MVGSTLVEVCGRLIFSFTRSVAEHVNRNEAEIIPQMCGYDILQNTGTEWYCQPVDELIFSTATDKYLALSMLLILARRDLLTPAQLRTVKM